MNTTADTYVTTMFASFILACVAVVYFHCDIVPAWQAISLLVYFVGTMTYSADMIHKGNIETARETRRILEN